MTLRELVSKLQYLASEDPARYDKPVQINAIDEDAPILDIDDVYFSVKYDTVMIAGNG